MSNSRRLVPIALIPVLFLGLGCVHGRSVDLGPTSGSFAYFAKPADTDPWSPKIAGWQSRERANGHIDFGESPAEVSGSAVAPPAAADEEAAPGVVGETSADEASIAEPTALRDKYVSFRRERRRNMARDVAFWIQDEARRHYVPDGPIDHWATLEETLERDGDDCDGLELLTYHFLLDLGFQKAEIYRAVVVRPSDGQHHMVTLWFEDPDDPWVIDPTGAMVLGMPRMSEVPGWVPLKVFSETEEYTARRVSARR